MRARVRSIGGVAAAMAAAWAGTALAQVPGPSPAAGVVSGQPGLNELTRPTAVAIETLCPFVSGLASPTPGQRQLGISCTAMVVAARGGSSVIPSALEAIAGEEMHAQGRVSSSAVGRNAIYGRLLALRGGGRGFLLTGTGVDPKGGFAHTAAVGADSPRGGGAAADDALGGRWGGFLNANYNTGDRDNTELENGFDFDDYGLTGGIDYRFSDALSAGVALSWSQTEVDFTRRAGDVESANWGVTAYASYSMGDWYVDGHLGFARMDYDTRRNIVIPELGYNTAARGSTEGDQWTATVGTGYDMRMNSLTVTPYGRVGYMHLKVDGFTEREPNAGLGLDIGSRTTRSLQSALGARVSTPLSTQRGVFTPYAAAEWNHEFKNDSRSLVAKYSNDPFNTFFAIPSENPDRNFFTVSVGVATVFAGGLSAFANVDTVLGLEDTSAYAFTVGVRGEF